MAEDYTHEDTYVWVSSGGCQRCDAMDGLEVAEHEQGSKPHPNCNCTVQRRPSSLTSCDESRLRYTVQYSHPIHHPNYIGGDSEFDLVFDYEIICPDGEMLSGQVLVTLTYDEQIERGMDDAEIEAIAMVDNIAAAECKSCGDPPPVV